MPSNYALLFCTRVLNQIVPWRRTLILLSVIGAITSLVLVSAAGFFEPTRIAVVAADVSFPSAEVAFIAGPQVISGSSSISGASWFDQNALDRGTSLCTAFPDVAQTPGNVLISGTVSVTNGTGVSQCVSGGVTHESCKVHGTGTHFLTDVKDYAIISNGTGRRIIKIVAGVQSDTELTLTLPWDGATASGRTISSPTATDVDNYQGYQMYYDFALTQYINYYRTGDTAYRDCARKAADSWYSQPIIDEGKNLISVTGEGLAPRMAAINGLMLRALDGRPEMWPWIKDYVDYQFHLWDEIRIDYPGLYFGVRDGGFMLLYAANLAATHPDATVRADFNARALAVAKNYYARLQQSDGSYRWNDEDFPMTGVEQPFQVGILNEAMIQVHRLTGDTTVRAAILKSADHEFTTSYKLSGWRAMYYFIHGTIGSPPVSCESGCGNASNPFPPSDTTLITEARQLNATTIHVFGYAFLLTGDTKYRDYGDEVFAATYSGTDGYRGLANTRGKEYDESYRSGGRYLAWREAATPTPTPTPTPPAGDVVWVEDTTPSGAILSASGGDDWTWVGTNPAPFSGSLASQSNISSADHQHYFYAASDTLTINTGDKLIAYVYLDPANVPSEIMLQWNDGEWEHRAYWGANNIVLGTNGTASRRFMGALPAAGQWVRLEVPASSVGLEGHVLTGMAFTLYGGRATWDHAGKSTAADTVWVEDTTPSGAILSATGGDDWTWTGTNPAPFSGSLASQSNISSADHQHYFYAATDTLTINTGEKLIAYVYLDPANVPSEIMLQWNDGEWEHRAYWGANNIPWGTNGTASRRFMGALPAAGQWVRLEVPASSVGLEGHVLTGMAFTLYGGRATWDYAGKAP